MSVKSIIEKSHIIEIITLVALIVIMAGLPGFVLNNSPWRSAHRNHRVINLTAVAKNGVWTEEKVTNLNYWNKEFKPAELSIQKGEKILFRFSSMDVTHSFYVPELNIGPVEVKGGMVYEVPFSTEKTGEFTYYCTTICGDSHYYMQGKILINDESEYHAHNLTENAELEFHRSINQSRMPGESSSIIEKGDHLYTTSGCITCHGEAGKGGISNPNYVNGSVPRLDDISEKMRIFWREDADVVIELLEQNVDLKSYLQDPPFRQYNRFLAQYESYTSKIHDGAYELQKADTTGPNPPLFMPAWKYQMSQEEINAILAYLIDQYDWEN
jgi:heme/copper-type cytochrome/quinol oxidase subunit 2